MTKSVIDRGEFGFETVAEAMEVLVSIYNVVPVKDLDDTVLEFRAGTICGILEMFFAYVDDNEDVDVQELMETVTMELSATVAMSDQGDEPQIH